MGYPRGGFLVALPLAKTAPDARARGLSRAMSRNPSNNASTRATLLTLALFTLAATACTENIRARKLGGTAKIEVKTGHKVVGASWKQSDLWVLTRPMHAGEAPETLALTESSSWGVVEGHVLLVEREEASK